MTKVIIFMISELAIASSEIFMFEKVHMLKYP
mgnify:CR=1 FL=1